jgi:type I restriction enzyme S subunit
MTSQLPTEWYSIPLGDVLTRITYGFTNPMPTATAGPFMVTAKDIRNGHIDYASARRTSKDAYDGLLTDKSRPRVGDILLTKDGSIGRVAVCDRPNVCINQSVALLQPNEMVDPHFLAYLLQAPKYQSLMEADASGSTIKHIYITRVDKMTIAIPPPREQSAIVGVLRRLDDKIAVNEQVSGLSLELARQRFRRKTRDVDMVSMPSVLTPLLGGTPSRSDAALWDGSVPWVSAKDITSTPWGVVTRTTEGISAAAGTVKRLAPLPIGSVVLTARGTVGEVARLQIEASINQSCYGFVPGLIPPSCLFFVIEAISTQARSLAHGSVFDTITMRTFDHVEVPNFGRAEWTLLESELEPILALSAQAVIESDRLRTARDELLPLLMSGRVRVRDAETIVEGVV